MSVKKKDVEPSADRLTHLSQHSDGSTNLRIDSENRPNCTPRKKKNAMTGNLLEEERDANSNTFNDG